MENTVVQQTGQAIGAVLPQHANNMTRLGALLRGGEPIITVIGKYNHGKSMLLNELIGEASFAVADRRETVRLAHHVQHGVRWLDAPGLDADTGTEDDRHAMHAAWLESDIRLFVHAAKEGELDAAELALLKELRADSEKTDRQTLFVLSQVDQLPGGEALNEVIAAIHGQLPGLEMHAVSSTRHRKGIDGDKPLLSERSGIPQLRAGLEAAVGRVPAARAHEAALLFTHIRHDLDGLRCEREQSLASLKKARQAQRQAFDEGLRSVICKAGRDIETMLGTLGVDHAAIPDTAADAYVLTAAKRERAYVQVAYSRACIDIDSYLVGCEVIAIPAEQETAARALNTVMIAVMGVSVKFRKDLRRMFCTEQGRERMQREFTRYYDISGPRKAQAALIRETESDIIALNEAAMSLQGLREAHEI